MRIEALGRVPSTAVLLTGALVVCFLIAGLVGHDPWKPDEGYTFGLVLDILESGNWVVPTLAGEPFMEKPPLYYLAAAASALLFSPVLPLHDGARIASLFFTAIAILCVGLAARKLFGAGHGQKAVLLFIGCFGLVQYSHQMITDTALLAGFAIATLGWCWALERPRIAGALLGTGVGVGFMSKGLLEPGVVGLTYVLLPMVFREWRRRAYLSSAAWALAFALPWLLLWPIALYSADKALFMDWLWMNNVGRYVGFAHLGADTEPWFYTRTLPWFTFPAGPIALWAIMKPRQEGAGAQMPGKQLTAMLSLVIVAILATSATARDLYALPLLVPLAILGSTAVDDIPRRLVLFFLAGLAALAASVAIAVWAIWGYGVVHGTPPAIPALLQWLPGDYRFGFVPPLAAFAALLSLAWVALWLRRSAGASWLHLWAASLVLIWGITMTLLLPWIDEAKSFRGTFVEMARHVPPSQCVSSLGLGEPQRGMLHYVAGLKTSRLESGSRACAYLLVQTSNPGKRRVPPAGGWTLVWKGARPGEAEETFSLYERQPPERIAEERRSAL